MHVYYSLSRLSPEIVTFMIYLKVRVFKALYTSQLYFFVFSKHISYNLFEKDAFRSEQLIHHISTELML